MDYKELPYAVTLSSILKEEDVAEKVKLATEHLRLQGQKGGITKFILYNSKS